MSTPITDLEPTQMTDPQKDAHITALRKKLLEAETERDMWKRDYKVAQTDMAKLLEEIHQKEEHLRSCAGHAESMARLCRFAAQDFPKRQGV